MNGIRKVASVLRVSTSGQLREGEDSIDKQRDAAKKMADAHGWEIVAEFDETAGGTKGQSGAARLDDRPFIQQMLQGAERGDFDAVIFFSADRLGRKKTEALRMLADLEDAEMSVGFSKDDKVYDASEVADAIMLLIGQVFAEVDYKDLVAKMAVGKYQRSKEGKYAVGQKPPTGFVLDRNTTMLVVDPDEAAVVKAIFELIAAGAGTFQTAEKVSAQFKAVRPKGISSGLVRRVIRRPEYTGAGIKRMVRPAVNEPKEELVFCVGEDFRIVSDELWNKANKMLDGHKNRPRVKQQRSDKPRLYGLRHRVKHQHTYGNGEAWAMNGATRVYRNKDKKKTLKKETRVYHCYAAHAVKKGEEDRCQGFGKGSGAGRMTAHPADLLEARVLLKALEALNDPATFEKAQTDFRDKVYREAGIERAVTLDPVERMAAVDEAIAGFESRQELIVDSYVDGVINKEQRDARLRNNEEALSALKIERMTLKSVKTTEDYWTNLLLPVAAQGAFGDVQMQNGEVLGWSDTSEMVAAEAQAVIDGEGHLSDESIMLCADLAELLDLTITVFDEGTAIPKIKVNGLLPVKSTSEQFSPSSSRQHHRNAAHPSK